VRKGRIVILLISLTVLALSAGVVAGLVAARLPGSSASGDGAPPPPPMPPEQSLAEQLQLSPDQRESMRGIWEGVREKVHKTFEDADSLQQERDQAVVALLNDEQKAKFEKISNDFANRYTDLLSQRDKLFDKAVENTKKLLNDEQRKKYEEILKSHVRPGPPMAGHGMHAKMFSAPAGSSGSSASQPVK
jgi:uncharacterized membrane protein